RATGLELHRRVRVGRAKRCRCGRKDRPTGCVPARSKERGRGQRRPRRGGRGGEGSERSGGGRVFGSRSRTRIHECSRESERAARNEERSRRTVSPAAWVERKLEAFTKTHHSIMCGLPDGANVIQAESVSDRRLPDGHGGDSRI